ncbi:type I methionyl aminopeptidase [Candidatus Gracilibacteria bacterium]|nr:type I methionyl aminopeptidase [Candidatus Gracilibacteria bacterium]
MRESAQILAATLEEVVKRAKVGVSTEELDLFAEQFILEKGGKPGFKGYHDYPATLCTARNEVIVHGIPGKNDILQDGDLFTVDCGVLIDGFYSDAARSIAIGNASPLRKRLVETAKIALKKGIEQAIPGNKIYQISQAIQKVIESEGFHVIYDLTGHGLGKSLHEDPIIANYFDPAYKQIIKPGMTFAIEPIFSAGTNHMKTLSDGWTIVTKDGSDSVQQEETILITETGNEILTKIL